MRRRLRWVHLSIALLFVGRVASASLFGEENVTLGSILAENVKQTADIAQTLRYVRSLTEEASDIAHFASDSVKVVSNIRLMFTNPVEFSRYVLRSWATAYPEVRDIYAHTVDIRMALSELNDPEFYRTYDPHAYVRAFDALQNVERGAYEIALRSADKWHIVESHDPALDAIETMHKQAIDAFQEMADSLNGSGMSPQRAQVHTAKTSTISMLASVEAARALEKMVTHQQVAFTMQQDSADADLKKLRVMEREALMVKLNWSLRPAVGSAQ
jgi:hypothetical protein